MSNWTLNDLKKKNLAIVGDKSCNTYSDISKGRKVAKVQKLPNLLERAIPNSKVKNATKTTVDGIVFDSKLEAGMYSLLKGAHIEFEHQKIFVLQNKFKYNGEAIREIKSIVDFWLPEYNMIIDTKGYANDVSPLKYKLLKKVLSDLDPLNTPKIEMPGTTKQCELLLNRLLYDNKN